MRICVCGGVIRRLLFWLLFLYRRDRERKPKRTALPNLALHADLAAMRFHNFFGDGESQAGAAAWGAWNAVKSLKNLLQIFLGNAFPSIGDLKPHHAVGR